MNLAHPLYLDVPMLLGALASIEGGAGHADALRAAREAASPAERRAALAPMFGAVHAQLVQKARALSTPKDIAKVSLGELVELEVTIRRGPLSELVMVIQQLLSGPSNAARDYGVPADASEVAEALCQQLDSSPVIEALATTDPGLTAVTALRREELTSPTIDDLRFGQVRLLGKVAGVVREDETWDLLGRSFLSHLLAGAVRDLVQGLQQLAPEGRFPLGSALKGPALLVHPLALYV